MGRKRGVLENYPLCIYICVYACAYTCTTCVHVYTRVCVYMDSLLAKRQHSQYAECKAFWDGGCRACFNHPKQVHTQYNSQVQLDGCQTPGSDYQGSLFHGPIRSIKTWAPLRALEHQSPAYHERSARLRESHICIFIIHTTKNGLKSDASSL